MDLEDIISQFSTPEENVNLSPESDRDWFVDWDWDPTTNESGEISSFFNDDSLCPIFGRQSAPVPTKDVLVMIAQGIDEAKSAKIVPSQPKENLSFMVLSSFLEHWKDILSDDLGVWTPNGTKTQYFGKLFDVNGSVSFKSEVDETTADFMTKRFLYSYPAEKDYKRIIVKPLKKTAEGWY